MIQLADHFRSDERRRHSEWLRQREWFIKAKQDQERREKAEEKLEDDLVSLATDVIIATEVQIAQFQMQLDRFDERTVAGLMESQQLLDRLYAEREALLARAYVMEDGRRVFKSEDGSFVIDEFGEIVSSDEFDSSVIPDHYPRADAIMDIDAKIDRGKEIQSRFHVLDAKVREAHREADDGDMSVERIEQLTAEFDDEFDALDAELDDLTPLSHQNQALSATATPFNRSALNEAFSRWASGSGSLSNRKAELQGPSNHMPRDIGMDLQH